MSSKRLALFLVLVLGLSLPALAQTDGATIRGKVTDLVGSPAAGVNVTLRSDAGLTRSTTTDADGTYAFTGLPAGIYQVTVDVQGFKPVVRSGIELAAGAVRQVDAGLELAEVAEEMVVTGSHIRGAGDTGAIAVSVLDIDVLDAFGAETAGETFANIAQAGEMEFNETADGPNSARGDIATVNLRNLGAGNTLVLLNGRRMTPHPISQDISQTPQTVVNVNTIPTAAIEQVEVLRDGASALYGADATAGVVNTVLNTGYEGFRFTFRDAQSQGTNFEERSLNFAAGRNFNDDRTNVTVFGTLFKRDGMFGSEREYSASVDKRPLLPEDWAGDTQFRNLSSRTPWGEFVAGGINPDGTFGGVAVSQDGSRITSSSGRFHIQPTDQSGGVPFGPFELDDGSQSSSIWYDFGIPRQITPDADRLSLFAALTHDLASGLQVFGELGYYDSSTEAQRAAQPIDDGLAFIIVPKQNYWNPFGPVGSPNRMDGIDAPDEGLDLLIRRWRPVEHGPRMIATDSDMYRILGGVRGSWKSWDWETALLYNEASVTDEEGNRFSKTLLVQQLGLSTPDAINPFGGPDANTPAQLDPARISSVNKAESSLASWDFRISNPAQFEIPGGPVGLAFGAEWRREEYLDDRDPRLDGTITFRGATGSDLSDVVGVSPTADSSGSRNVFSGYGEALVPLIGPAMEIAGAQRLDLQVALRGESFQDTGEDIVKPKLALSWFPADWLLVRTTWAQGFRVPNLVQLNRDDISRLNQGQEDFWRSDVTRLAEDTGDTYRRSVRASNPDLISEETETFIVGFELHLPVAKRLSFSVDYYEFEQENVIDNFGVEEQLALDFLRRKEGSSNPNVVRLPVTQEDLDFFAAWNAANPDDLREPAGVVDFVRDPYLNLDPRNVEGIDYGVRLIAGNDGVGEFRLQLEAANLRRFDQRRDALQPLLDDPFFADEFSAQQVDRIGLNGKPEWRASGSLTWRREAWGAGLSYKYIDRFFDTSARNDVTDEFWTVQDWAVWSLYAEYRLKAGVHIRGGVNNITDEDPPLADESRGYFSSYHDNRGRQFYVRLSYGR